MRTNATLTPIHTHTHAYTATQPVPYSESTPHGMPQEFEDYYLNPDYAIINVPPLTMFDAKCFKPARLCAVYELQVRILCRNVDSVCKWQQTHKSSTPRILITVESSSSPCLWSFQLPFACRVWTKNMCWASERNAIAGFTESKLKVPRIQMMGKAGEGKITFIFFQHREWVACICDLVNSLYAGLWAEHIPTVVCKSAIKTSYDPWTPHLHLHSQHSGRYTQVASTARLLQDGIFWFRLRVMHTIWDSTLCLCPRQNTYTLMLWISNEFWAY